MTNATGAYGTDLKHRVLSVAVMLALCVPIIYYGGVFLLGLIAVLWVGLCWEVIKQPMSKGRAVHTVALLILVQTLAFCVYLTLFAAPSYLFFLFFLSTLWITDSAAYIGGKWIGGPRLAPYISPNKTWSGFVSGLVTGQMWGVGFLMLAAHLQGINLLIGLVLPIVASLSDLGQSWAKRTLGIKDTSNLIPGHGGLWDRLDSTLGTLLFFEGVYMLFPQAWRCFIASFAGAG
ncbi:phosphatidate cytidylyltransferase [Candidatus Hepatobacter penaei]|uniref:phosphatidate cytidylyltransferase n=1 Tax=Candidatus Hepatobacter penaei TaxID=1274402 RepID=UPI000697A9A2|nr:phosphatidate cytidylyltransferase [Candidatus Hepatobacter penaei]TGW15124.1 phosphatidate cytidylyltransferase [bacterium NHP-B]